MASASDIDRYEQAIGRIGFGLAAIGAEAVGLWPAYRVSLDLPKAIVFATAVSVWIYAELFKLNKPIVAEIEELRLTEHDKALAIKIYRNSGDGLVNFLKFHDFGVSWRGGQVAPIYELAHMLEMASSKFVDVQLQGQLIRVLASSQALAKCLAYEGVPIGSGSVFSMIPDEERTVDWFSEKTTSRVKKANDLAEKMANELESIFHSFAMRGINLIKDEPSIFV